LPLHSRTERSLVNGQPSAPKFAVEQPGPRPVSRQFSLQSSSPAVRFLCGSLVLFSMALLLWRTHPVPTQAPRDFETLYASTYCLTHHCNPYNIQVLNDVLLAQHQVPTGAWTDTMPIYPPTSMMLLAPLSYLPFDVAAAVWFALAFAAYCLAVCWLFLIYPGLQSIPIPVRAAVIALLMLFPKAAWALSVGNPSLLVISLLIFITFDENPSRQNLRLALFCAACLLKPQLSLPFILLLYLRGDRSSFKRIFVAFAVLAATCAVVFFYASRYPETADWATDIAENLRQATAPGMSMDPSLRMNGSNSLLNVQYILGYWISRSALTQAISLSFNAFLGIIFLWAAWKNLRRPMSTSSESYILAAATLASLVLLPVYHRFYDAAILIFALPWILRCVSRGSHARRVILPLLLLAVLYKDWLRTVTFPMTGSFLGQTLTFIHFRYESLSALLLACTLLAIFLLQERARPGSEAR